MSLKSECQTTEKILFKGMGRKEKIAQILAAAESVFSEEGYKGASIGMIAEKAHLPKPNIYYYFSSKDDLYRCVIEGICEDWMAMTKTFSKDGDPRAILFSYVRAKMALARHRPKASRVWAMEMARGAPFIQDYLSQSVKPWLETCAETVRHWADKGRIAPVDAQALFYMIWATTQHYADFEAQMISVNEGNRMTDDQFEKATMAVTQIVLRAVGLSG